MPSHGVGDRTPDEQATVVMAWRRLARHLFAARIRADLYQRQVARRMGTTANAISRLENAVGSPPSFGTLHKYARAVGCRLEIRLVARDWRDDDDADD
jgi:transcriptional regulator with XRE-family HTH domain